MSELRLVTEVGSSDGQAEAIAPLFIVKISTISNLRQNTLALILNNSDSHHRINNSTALAKTTIISIKKCFSIGLKFLMSY